MDTKLLARMYKYIIVDPETGCADWHGSVGGKGYPMIRHKGKLRIGGRLLWETIYGEIPEGLLVLHNCDNPRCMNISHLRLGTYKDNWDDMKLRGRRKAK
jgi:hypothetical protein